MISVKKKREYGSKPFQNLRHHSDSFLEHTEKNEEETRSEESFFFCRDLTLGSAEHEPELLPFEWRSLVISCNQFSGYRVFMKYGNPVVSTEMRRARFTPTVRDSAL